MKNNKFVSVILTGMFLAVFAGVLPTAINAQQGRYINVYNKNQVRGYIDKLDISSKKFRADFDRYMDQSNLNGTPTEDRFNGYVRDYAQSLDRLRNEYSNSNNWWDNRNNVQQMIARAQPVNQMMNTLSFANKLEKQWRNMRDDINKVADTFDMPGLNGGGWNGGPWNGGNGNGGQQGNVPSWAQGTFYGRNPQTGGPITLTIERSGRVSVDFQGSQSFGSLNGQTLNINGDNARVTQINNGIRTTGSDRQSIDYYRNAGNVNNGGGNYVGNVPSWAVGTFYGRNPQTGGTITITVNKNGNVNIDFDGGTSSYGTLDNGILRVDNATSRVTKIRNGIRTTSTGDGQFIEYFTNRPR